MQVRTLSGILKYDIFVYIYNYMEWAVVNWDEIQKSYDEGMTLPNIYKLYKIGHGRVYKAHINGFINLHKRPRKKYVVSQATRILLSQSMKKAHKSGAHPGWSHINKINRRSYPEQCLYDKLISSEITNKFFIIEKMPFNKYFLDFAFPEIKLDLEIDGQQHYNTINAIKHDEVRNKFLNKNGWKVYRIKWDDFKMNKDFHFSCFVEYIKTIEAQTDKYYDVVLKPKKIRLKRDEYIRILRQNQIEKNLDNINKITNSDIDFGKFGWVSKAAKLLGKHQQKINSWIKKYMLDFYENKCFKKKINKHT